MDDILGLLGQGIRSRGGLLGAFLPMSEAEREEQRRKQLQAQYLQEQMAQMQFTRQQAQAQAQAQLMAQQEAQRKAQEAAAQQARVMAAGQRPEWAQNAGPLGALVRGPSDTDAAMGMARAGGDVKTMAELLKMQQPEYGMTLTAGVGPDGKPAFLQPSKRGGAQVVRGVSPQQEKWERIPTPEGIPPGQQWYRNTVTGEERPQGQRPPAPAIGSLTVGGSQLERKEQQDKGSLNVKYYGEIKTAADAARKEAAILQNMEKNPLQTGAGVPLMSTAANWLAYAGMASDRVKALATDSQTFTRDAMDLVLQKQLAQKGPQTESDAKRLEQTVGNLKNTPEANAAIIKFGLAQARRTMRQERFYDEWWRKNKTYEGADEAWFNGEGGQSLWESPELKGLVVKSAQSGLTPEEEAERQELRRRLGRQ